MKVSELVGRLQRLDQSADVLCYIEDETLATKPHVFRVLEIVDVNESHAEKVRLDDHSPSLKLGKSEFSQNHVFIEVTTDF